MKKRSDIALLSQLVHLLYYPVMLRVLLHSVM